jgi:hypothetical protein
MYPTEDIEKQVANHLKYGTYSIAFSEGRLVGILRFNVNGLTAEGLDCVVHPDYSMKSVFKYLLLAAWKKFPYVRYVTFERLSKYPFREPRFYELQKLISKARR